jgi:hypothetical protein
MLTSNNGLQGGRVSRRNTGMNPDRPGTVRMSCV